jgi:hypothetical protein
MALTRIERNQIFEAIREILDPTEFSLTFGESTAAVRHNSGSMFEVADAPTVPGTTDRGYRVNANVEDSSLSGSGTSHEFSSVISLIQQWAIEIRKVAETPDYWAEMQASRELITDMQRRTDADNTPFTENEQIQVAAQLQAIKDQLREQFELTNEQMEQVEQRLDEAAEASKRMGRKDWIIYFLGTISALIITATVTGGVGEHIITMFFQAIGYLITGSGKPPHPLT